MNVLDSPQVTGSSDGETYRVQISHGEYLVAFDRAEGLWWAFDSHGSAINRASSDPLACSSDVCSGWERAADLVKVLLAFDGEQVPS